MRMFSPCLLVMLLLFSVSVAALAGSETTVLTESDNGRELVVPLDSVILVQLRELGAAGYVWEFDALDAEHLQILSSETKAEKKDGITGAPVTKVWLLKARKKGNTRLRMSCYRVWEGKGKASRKFGVDILIH